MATKTTRRAKAHPAANLPLSTSYQPMHALLVSELPSGEQWQYEPKWDGFRCLVFKDSGAAKPVQLMSKNGQPLARYFPELVSAVEAIKADKFILDGEIVIPQNGALSFDALLQRIHPAETRIRRLAAETPATLILFDILAADRKLLADRPLGERREQLEKFFKRAISRNDHEHIRLSPATPSYAVAKRWFGKVGGALDGIIAKRI